jgi:hypothetical protein
MNVVLVGPVSEHTAQDFVQACEDNGCGAVLVCTPNAPFEGLRPRLTGYLQVSSLALPVETLAKLVAPFRPAAVVPAGELAVVSADRLAARLGLFHNPLDRLRLYREKDAMRAAFAEAGVPQPRVYATFGSAVAMERFDWSGVRFPVIAKPVDGSASYFTRRCDTVEEILGVVPQIVGLERSRATGVEYRRRALIEELIEGPEYSADCIVSDGDLRVVLTREKIVSPYPHCDITAHLVGDVLPASATNEIATVVQRIVRAFRVTDTVMHVEFKVERDSGCIRILEVGNRIAGDHIASVVELRHGWRLAEALVRLRLRRGFELAHRPDRAGPLPAYGVRFLFEPAGPPRPTAVVVLHRGSADCYPPDGDHGPFHVTRRVGYEIVGSDDIETLRTYLASPG